MCGGSGSRLFPLSRDLLPKQFIKLDCTGNSLFKSTFFRNSKFSDNIIISTSANYKYLVKYSIPDNNYNLILEPCSKNTGPSILNSILDLDKNDIVVIVPSDHYIDDIDYYYNDINKGIDLARNNYIVTFGTEIKSPNTNFGYIELTKKIENNIFISDKFIEKPNIKLATDLFSSNKFLLNTGIFISKVSILIENFIKYYKDFEFARNIYFDSERNGNSISISNQYKELTSISFDNLILENLSNIACIKSSFIWSDVGNFNDLSKVFNNSIEELNFDSYNNNVYNTTNKKIILNEVSDLNVVCMNDAILISHRNADSRKFISDFKLSNDSLNFTSSVGYRPWGSYEIIYSDIGYLIKKIFVNPGHQISVQYHNHRTEHWTIMSGFGSVLKGDCYFNVQAGSSIFIDKLEIHQIINIGSEPLIFIEIQSGNILDESDIIRLSDIYNR